MAIIDNNSAMTAENLFIVFNFRFVILQ